MSPPSSASHGARSGRATRRGDTCPRGQFRSGPKSRGEGKARVRVRTLWEGPAARTYGTAYWPWYRVPLAQQLAVGWKVQTGAQQLEHGSEHASCDAGQPQCWPLDPEPSPLGRVTAIAAARTRAETTSVMAVRMKILQERPSSRAVTRHPLATLGPCSQQGHHQARGRARSRPGTFGTPRLRPRRHPWRPRNARPGSRTGLTVRRTRYAPRRGPRRRRRVARTGAGDPRPTFLGAVRGVGGTSTRSCVSTAPGSRRPRAGSLLGRAPRARRAQRAPGARPRFAGDESATSARSSPAARAP